MTFLSGFFPGQYPQDVHVSELSQDELEVTWLPPKSFSNTDLNYLVNCYSLSEQRIHTKTHEIIAQKTSCVLDNLQKDVTYKISVWSIQATTQKKRGLPTQTKYIIKEKGTRILATFNTLHVLYCQFRPSIYIINQRHHREFHICFVF
jgi:hypothetical protein